MGIFSNKSRSSNAKKAGKLSKKWRFGSHTSVEEPALKAFSRLTKPTNKLWALMSGHYMEVELWTVTVHFPDKLKGEHGKLSLCFTDRATAERWHSAIASRIALCANKCAT